MEVMICFFTEITLISQVSALQKQQNNKVCKNIQLNIAAVHSILQKVCKENKISNNSCVYIVSNILNYIC